jgi:methyl-accepting chemotaxis protein
VKTDHVRRKLGKIALVLIAASVAVAAGFGALDYLASKRRLARDFEEMMRPVPIRLAGSLAKPLWFLDTGEIENLIRLEMMNPGIFGIEVMEADGRTIHIALVRDADWEIVPARAPVAGNLAVRSETVHFEDKPIGEVRVHFTHRLVEEELGRLARSMAIRAPAMSISLVLVLMAISKRFLIDPIACVVAGLARVGAGVESAGRRVSAAGENLSRGTAGQASAVEETSASLEEIVSMIRRNAENVSRADRLMTETADVVREAAGAMAELIDSMDRITGDGEKTRTVVRTIEEIAFRTHLLALNAAVEAARAGEAGAGFAVVAEEVRNLAARSGEAARETAEMIESSVREIRSGGALAARADEAFGRVSEKARQVEKLLAEATAASREQAEGIGRIGRAMADIDRVTRENAAGAEETSGALSEIESMIDRLGNIIRELGALAGVADGGPSPTIQRETYGYPRPGRG